MQGIRYVRLPVIALTAGLVVGPSSFAVPLEVVSQEWAEKWRADLQLVSEELPELHANLFHTLTAEAFEGALHDLKRRVPFLSHHEIVVELARIVASIGDGHTRLSLPFDPAFFQGHAATPEPSLRELTFRQYPLRLYLYTDGLYVQRIARKYADAVGAKVLGIGTMSVERAMEAVRPIIQRDNPMQVRHHLPTRLVVPEVLHACGVIEDMESVRFRLLTVDGKERTLELEPLSRGHRTDWVDARDDAPSPLPLYLKNRRRNFWFEYLEDSRILYLQYNRVDHEDDESIPAFADRLSSFIEASPVETVIVDLRWNTGGDNTLNNPLLLALLRAPELRPVGRLFTIIGRETFSAAMHFALELEKHTKTLFVGEPTGSSPNAYGDARKLTLPNTGLAVRASTLYWQCSDPRDRREWIAPHIPIGLSSADYRANRDPVLQALVALSHPDVGEARLEGTWKGKATMGTLSGPLQMTFERTEGRWRGTLALPHLGKSGLILQPIRRRDRRLSFELVVEDETIVFDAVVRGNRLIGEASDRGHFYPFALERVD